MIRYGGNTSCVRVELSDGTQLVLDAGTGIRNVPDEGSRGHGRTHVLLTHLHLDHIQGLLFFSPLFRAESEITIWGPAAPGRSLRDRIGRYLSAPLTPIEVRELPCQLNFRNCPVSEWELGSAKIRAEAITHRGPTLGFRIEDAGRVLCYLPDHEPAMIGPIEDLEPEWVSGYSLAHEADVLLHDSQYTDEEYPSHFGWGHSALSHALWFAKRCEVKRTMLFHHDPHHTDDQLDTLADTARELWSEIGGAPETVAMAVEGAEFSVDAAPPELKQLV
jgi:ribonuclease BN (tRNA processing enzyme)